MQRVLSVGQHVAVEIYPHNASRMDPIPTTPNWVAAMASESNPRPQPTSKIVRDGPSRVSQIEHTEHLLLAVDLPVVEEDAPQGRVSSQS